MPKLIVKAYVEKPVFKPGELFRYGGRIFLAVEGNCHVVRRLSTTMYAVQLNGCPYVTIFDDTEGCQPLGPLEIEEEE